MYVIHSKLYIAMIRSNFLIGFKQQNPRPYSGVCTARIINQGNTEQSNSNTYTSLRW